MKTKIEIQNCLTSNLSNMVNEFKLGTLTEEDIYIYFSSFLIDANVNSLIVVNVLESEEFGELGKQQALSIKVNEGW